MARRVDNDPQNPELTEEFFARAKRGTVHLPDQMRDAIEYARRGRGPQRAPTKTLVSIRLDPNVVAAYRATGPGWQSRINDALLHTPTVARAAHHRTAAKRAAKKR